MLFIISRPFRPAKFWWQTCRLTYLPPARFFLHRLLMQALGRIDFQLAEQETWLMPEQSVDWPSGGAISFELGRPVAQDTARHILTVSTGVGVSCADFLPRSTSRIILLCIVLKCGMMSNRFDSYWRWCNGAVVCFRFMEPENWSLACIGRLVEASGSHAANQALPMLLLSALKQRPCAYYRAHRAKAARWVH